MVSFHTGFKVDRIVLVFFLTLSASGISFIFTYGSLKPFGSMGIKLRPCFTVGRGRQGDFRDYSKWNGQSTCLFEQEGIFNLNFAKHLATTSSESF